MRQNRDQEIGTIGEKGKIHHIVWSWKPIDLLSHAKGKRETPEW